MDSYNNLINNTKIELCLVGGMLGLTVISGAVASSMKVNADDNDSAVTTASVTVAASCSMTSNVDIPHTAEISNGTYQANIGQTTIKTFCNDNSGYAIYAIGFTGDKYDGEDHTKLIGATNGQKIVTGTATSGNTSNWAMKLTKVTDSTESYNPENLTITNGYDDYNVIPDTYTKVANYTSTTDLTLGSVITTTYAAYISPTEVADTYTGKVKYTLVHPNTEVPAQPQTTQTGKICYYANASDAVGTMGCQDVAESLDLLASNFSRNNYGFAGWSNKFDYATNTDSDLKFYGPNETITLNTADYTGDNNGLSLYAVWVKSQGSIQDTSKVATVCSSLTTAPIDGTANLSSVSALTDQRDNNTYAIAKLADGNCWMIENLRLESTAEHNSDGTLAQGYGTSTTYGNFSGLADAEAPWENIITTANSLYSTDGSNDTINIGTSKAVYRFPRYNHDNTNSRASSPTANTVAMYSYGNYYTWHAAIADTTAYSSGDHNTTSICPTGWKIPLGNTSTGDIEQGLADTANKVGGFSYLDRKMGGTGQTQSTAADSLRWRKYPVNFLYSGYVYSGSVGYRGSNGYYWSSTANDNNYAYYLDLGSTYVYPGTNYIYKYNGRAIRCLASS